MEVTFYAPFDPRRLKPSAFKSMDDLAPVLSQGGEQITINSQTESSYEQEIPVYRDLVISGKLKASFIMHGHTNLTLSNATVTSAPTSRATITLANDFCGIVRILNSTIKFKNGNRMDGYALTSQAGGKRPAKIELANSTLDGIAAMPDLLSMQGTIKIYSTSKSCYSVLNCSRFADSNAHIIGKNIILMQSSTDYARLGSVELVEGPIEFNGKWDIHELIVNADSKSIELFKFNGSQLVSDFKIQKITVKKSPKGLSLFYSINAILNFNNASLGDPKTKYSVAIKDSVIRMKQTADHVDWLLEGKNGLTLDDASITNLRGRQNEFVPLNKPKQLSINSNDTIKPEKNNNSNNNQNNILPQTSQNTQIETNAQNKTKTDVKSANGLTQLNQLIGLTSVKSKLRKFIRLAAINSARKKRGLQEATGINRHMVFGGNPGTGKTTVARLVARILYENGALPSPNFKEFTTKDLIGKVVGETTQKTHKAVEQSLGGVMFIDEAYMLGAKGNSFAPEAVGQLLKDMEDNKDNLIVILAGYTEEMHKFLDTSNEGMRSRFNNWVEFPDYTYPEKLEIFQAMCKKDGMIFNDQVMHTKVFKWCMQYYNRDHSNARSVRNFYQALVLAQGDRLGNGNTDNVSNQDLMTITADDLRTVYKNAVVSLKNEKKEKELAKKQAEKGTKFNSMGNDE